MTLLDESVPRSERTVSQLTKSVSARVGKLGGRVAWIFFATMIVAGTLIAASGLREGGDARESATMAVLFVVFMGILPGFVIRRILRRDARSVPDLVRNASAYPARVVSCDRLPYGGAAILTLEWREGERSAAARFDVDTWRDGPDTAVVLARAGQRIVGAVIADDDFFLGRRSL